MQHPDACHFHSQCAGDDELWVRWLEKVLDVLHSSALCTAEPCVVQINDLKTYLNSTYLTLSYHMSVVDGKLCDLQYISTLNNEKICPHIGALERANHMQSNCVLLERNRKPGSLLSWIVYVLNQHRQKVWILCVFICFMCQQLF